jgi:hypothetical protein
MNVDIDAGADLVNASLVARQIDGAAKAGDAHGAHGGACANCGAPLVGAFCHACGQRAHLHRSLLHLGEEFLHGILHFDAKAWRTIPLLVARPGQLTRRYIDGHRTIFVSPLALFLFMMFLMFFTVSSTNHRNKTVADVMAAPQTLAEGKAKLEKSIAAKEAMLAKLAPVGAALAAKGADAADVAEAKHDLDELRGELDGERKALALLVKTADNATAQAVADALRTANTTDKADKPFDFDDLHITLGWQAADDAIKHAFKNPELTLYKLKNAASSYSFLLVPISLPFLWLMFFWKRGVTMYDHAVFTLYSLSFMALLVVVMALLKFAGVSGRGVGWLLLLPPLHMFLQLRGTYRLRTFSALWRTGVLVCVAGTVFLLYLTLILILSIR